MAITILNILSTAHVYKRSINSQEFYNILFPNNNFYNTKMFENINTCYYILSAFIAYKYKLQSSDTLYTYKAMSSHTYCCLKKYNI